MKYKKILMMLIAGAVMCPVTAYADTGAETVAPENNITTDNWMENSLQNGTFNFDVNQFNLVEMPSDMKALNQKYNVLMANMEEQGFGERSGLVAKEMTGYSENAMETFDNKYGELFQNGLQLEIQKIPEDFDIGTMFANASANRDAKYAEITGSDSFQNIKNSISISNLADKYKEAGNYTLKSTDDLFVRIGVSTDGLDSKLNFENFEANEWDDILAEYQNVSDSNYEDAQGVNNDVFDELLQNTKAKIAVNNLTGGIFNITEGGNDFINESLENGEISDSGLDSINNVLLYGTTEPAKKDVEKKVMINAIAQGYSSLDDKTTEETMKNYQYEKLADAVEVTDKLETAGENFKNGEILEGIGNSIAGGASAVWNAGKNYVKDTIVNIKQLPKVTSDFFGNIKDALFK